MPTPSTILHLPTSRRNFEAVVAGERTVDYRDYTDSWCARLLVKDDRGEYRDARSYDIVRFRNGYTATSPTVDVEFVRAELVEYPDQPRTSAYRLGFAIHLGKVLKVSHYPAGNDAALGTQRTTQTTGSTE